MFVAGRAPLKGSFLFAGGAVCFKGALPFRGCFVARYAPRNDEGALERWSALQGGKPPRAFSGEKAHPSQVGEWRGL